MAQPARQIGRKPEIVGREAERRLIARCFDDARPGVATVVLTGDAGIGKTALWDWAVRAAVSAGDVVLLSRAGMAEARPPWAVLCDLLGGMPKTALDALPAPQRHALRIVMRDVVDAGTGAGAETPDERTVGTAVSTALTAATAAAWVLIAIDDWTTVDPASAAALRFALRRVTTAARVRIVATTRGEPPLPRDAGLDAGRVTPIAVGPLPVGAIYELLASRLRVRLGRPALLRLYEASGGNPLYAIELARALDRPGTGPASGAPPVPAGLSALIAERVRDLPSDVLRVAAATAAAWRLPESGASPEVLARAVASGVVDIERAPLALPAVTQPLTDSARDRRDIGPEPVIIRPAHPMVSAAAYAALAASARQSLHEYLAGEAGDPVERARHLALAASGPAAEVARALDTGAAAALAAGTPDIAADLARLALDRTAAGTGSGRGRRRRTAASTGVVTAAGDPNAQRAGRLDTLADALCRTGDAAGALDARREAVDLTPAGPARAYRRARLSEVMADVIGWDAAEAELEGALTDAAADPVVTARVLLTIVTITGDVALRDVYAARAVALLEHLDDPDPSLLSAALTQAAGARFRAGRGLDHDGFRRAIDIEKRHPTRRLPDRADASYAALLTYADDFDESESRLRALLDEARASGDLRSIVYPLAHLPQIEVWRGRLAEAHALAAEYLAAVEQGGLTAQLAQARYSVGHVLAHEGRLDEAESLLTSALNAPASSDWDQQRAYGGLGFVALSRGDAVAASGYLDCWHSILIGMQFGEPGYSRSHLDYLAALVGADRITDAERFLIHLDRQVATSGRESAAAVAMTGRALIEAAHGQLPAAQATIARSLDWYASSSMRFDRARTLLIAGRIHRRAKAKGHAHAAIAQARAQFGEFGAAAWAALADAELARVNLRPTAPGALTETERRVAELIASGMTNREAAQQLFLAVKTVEGSLARVYRKLGIRSRGELAARIGRLEP